MAGDWRIEHQSLVLETKVMPLYESPIEMVGLARLELAGLFVRSEVLYPLSQ